jgi:LuxR family maltose regulon positive regulatory protein
MAETPGRIPQRTVAVGSEALLATKLYLPRPPAGLVARPRLVDQLDEGLARELTLVCAPAGFGKTALLAEWSQRREPPVAWLSLDAGDNDPVRFWRHVAAALDRARPGVAERVAPLLGPPAPTSFESLVTAVINELDSDHGEVLLVLDDYHLVDVEPVHESLLFLIEHAPPGLHAVLASRADPPLPLARLRARGQLTELRIADLRFTDEEAAALLREALGSTPPDEAVAALAARTEGWAAGLWLAGLSLRGQSDVAGFVATFSGSHRYVLDYLAEEVLERLPQPTREFLQETSVLERLSGSLCDAVTGRTDGQQMLEAIERANLFLVPLDGTRSWWRYHQLFADLLRARLQQRQPERQRQLHAKAAAWHEDHGLVDDAVHHALAANDAARATRLVERHFDELYLSSEGATIQRWLAALPAGLVNSRPRLLLAQAGSAIRGGRVDGVEDLLDAAEHAFASAADQPDEPPAGGAASRLTNVSAALALAQAFVAHFRGDAEATTASSSQGLAELETDEWMLGSVAHTLLAAADWLRGRLGHAEHALTSVIAQQGLTDEPDLAALTCNYLGHVQCAQGHLDAALQTYRQALEAAAAPDQPGPAAGVAHVGMAEVAYERNDLDTALDHVTNGIALGRRYAYTQTVATGLATLAWIRLAAGDPTGAQDAMAEAEQISDPAVTDLLNPVPAQRARLLIAQGDVAAAAHWAHEHGLGAHDQPAYPQERAYLVLARVLLAQDQPDQALGLLDRLHADATAQDRKGSVIEIQALRALALAATGDEANTVPALTKALTLAHPQGHVRVFADEGPPMGALLGQVIATRRTDQAAAPSVAPAYLGRLVRAFERRAATDAGDEPRTPNIPSPVTTLSPRELEVLQLLATGKQNQDIASELYVARNTVKKHVTHILNKLGATNRTEATTRARELGLLP